MFFPTPLYNLASIHCDIQEFVHAHLSRASHSISISLTSGLDPLLFQPFFCVRDHCHCHHWSNWVRLELSDRWHLTFDSRVFWYTQESMVDLMIARCTDPVAAKKPYILAFPHHRVWHLVCGFCTDMLCLVFTERRACLASWPIISTLDILLYRIIHVMFISTSAP